MRLASSSLAIAAALVVLTTGASAQRSVTVLENDAVARTDRDYTNGFRQSFVFEDFSRDLLAARVFEFVKPGLITLGAPNGPANKQIEWIALAQSIFTPDRQASPTRLPGDRPFGGWLYTGFNASQETGRTQLDSFEVLVGAVGGSASLAPQVQSSIHELLGQKPPAINGYELHNEPGFLVAWDRRWKAGLDFGNGYGVDVIPFVGFTGGNVFTYGSVGAIARLGRSLSTTWGPTLVRPAASGASFFSRNPAAPFWGYDVFAGVEVRGVARNIFLDGNTFEDSIHVTRKPLVTDLIVGAEIFTQAGFSLSGTVIRRSREYTTQLKPSTFGSVAGSFRF